MRCSGEMNPCEAAGLVGFLAATGVPVTLAVAVRLTGYTWRGAALLLEHLTPALELETVQLDSGERAWVMPAEARRKLLVVHGCQPMTGLL